MIAPRRGANGIKSPAGSTQLEHRLCVHPRPQFYPVLLLSNRNVIECFRVSGTRCILGSHGEDQRHIARR